MKTDRIIGMESAAVQREICSSSSADKRNLPRRCSHRRRFAHLCIHWSYGPRPGWPSWLVPKRCSSWFRFQLGVLEIYGRGGGLWGVFLIFAVEKVDVSFSSWVLIKVRVTRNQRYRHKVQVPNSKFRIPFYVVWPSTASSWRKREKKRKDSISIGSNRMGRCFWLGFSATRFSRSRWQVAV